MSDQQVPVSRDVLQDALDVIGEWLEELVYNVYERNLEPETETVYQEMRERANEAFDSLALSLEIAEKDNA